MIGWLLCKIGYHDWHHVEFRYGDWYECSRCPRKEFQP